MIWEDEVDKVEVAVLGFCAVESKRDEVDSVGWACWWEVDLESQFIPPTMGTSTCFLCVMSHFLRYFGGSR